MNAYNSEKYVEEAIKSIIDQTYTNWELIFWDNQSIDKTKKIVEAFKDNRIKYFLSKNHTPLGMARLNALKQCKGDFISFLDSDDLWFKNKLELQLPLFDDPEVGLVASNSIFFNNKFEKKLFDKKIPKQGFVFAELLNNYFIDIETVILRVSYVKRLDNSFDTRFNSISDFDLFMRVLFISKLALIEEPTAKWRMHEGSETFMYPHKFIDEFKKWIFKIKNEHPQIINSFKKDWKKFETNTIINETKYYLNIKDKENCYKAIKDYKFFNLKTFIIYFCIRLPFSLQIYKLIKKIKKIFY